MKTPSTRIAIILFGGIGSRFSLETPKQFVALNGKPLCYYAVNACEKSKDVDKIVIVANKNLVEETKNALAPFLFSKIIAFVPGGNTRQESVLSALTYLQENSLAQDDDLVLIQDGDRPGLTSELIQENFHIAENLGGAVTARSSTDSVFLSSSKKEVDSYLDRSTLLRAETPQTFRFAPIYNAAKKAQMDGKGFTDDASCFIYYGGRVGIVLSNGHNQKITTKEDLYLFEGVNHE